ncbi:MAG TPA: hypothetical protein VMT34_03025 [Aggregatilineales bacterium]|nr:hypothetical protein [Aggregatilineales bacterium]
MKRKWLITAAALAVMAIPAVGFVSVSAQGPATPPATPAAGNSQPGNPPSTQPRGPRLGGLNIQPLMTVQACRTTNPTDIVAKALGMSASDLRVALVSGKSLQDLESAKNVSSDAIRSALTDAEKADVAQAVKDGTITQAQADAITSRLNRGNGRPGARIFGRGGVSVFAGGVGAGGVSQYNTVNDYVVAAQAIGVKCSDLATAVFQSGQSIAQVATSKNVQAQTVIDALVQAHTAALDQDVKEGLITTAQETGRTSRLAAEMQAFVNRTAGRGGRGGMFGFFGMMCPPASGMMPQMGNGRFTLQLPWCNNDGGGNGGGRRGPGQPNAPSSPSAPDGTPPAAPGA